MSSSSSEKLIQDAHLEDVRPAPEKPSKNQKPFSYFSFWAWILAYLGFMIPYIVFFELQDFICEISIDHTGNTPFTPYTTALIQESWVDALLIFPSNVGLLYISALTRKLRVNYWALFVVAFATVALTFCVLLWPAIPFDVNGIFMIVLRQLFAFGRLYLVGFLPVLFGPLDYAHVLLSAFLFYVLAYAAVYVTVVLFENVGLIVTVFALISALCFIPFLAGFFNKRAPRAGPPLGARALFDSFAEIGRTVRALFTTHAGAGKHLVFAVLFALASRYSFDLLFTLGEVLEGEPLAADLDQGMHSILSRVLGLFSGIVLLVLTRFTWTWPLLVAMMALTLIVCGAIVYFYALINNGVEYAPTLYALSAATYGVANAPAAELLLALFLMLAPVRFGTVAFALFELLTDAAAFGATFIPALDVPASAAVAFAPPLALYIVLLSAWFIFGCIRCERELRERVGARHACTALELEAELDAPCEAPLGGAKELPVGEPSRSIAHLSTAGHGASSQHNLSNADAPSQAHTTSTKPHSDMSTSSKEWSSSSFDDEGPSAPF
eukprot:gnl/Chilomastix_cuspidata/657.p1 GENE.gnl/Chilomastix_cuspidata/657~~gnl/Chilomastix_cuspidata/657.p1  ORF type:complete len:553 (-),score=203.03 gnl/Chilomastix_cuspidata/657:44-1702(-)